ncbi:MAG TPA: S41 family peptidase [bacterium]|nr:S41 family peptidase [bacterium]
MMPSHGSPLRPVLAGLLVAVLLLAPFTRVQHAAAADASLVIAAIRVLQEDYVDPVRPVPLLNAAIAVLRKATNSGPAVLPDIGAGATASDAAGQFSAEFSRAAQTGAMPETELAYTATAGMLASLHDSHTFFLDPASLREARRQIEGNPGFTGIGVTIVSRKDAAGTAWIFVEDVFPGSPAAGAGVHRFDRIVEVDGKPLKDVNVVDASQTIRGPAGSTASLVVQRAGRMIPISVVRAEIRVPPVEARFASQGVAYLKVFGFSQGAGRSLRQDIANLMHEGEIKSVILDLRGNPGGLIVEAASVGGIFLPSRTVLARITERGQQPSVLRASGTSPLAKTPLVVLVDGQSASASEILAGAFKDYHRATIIGEKTAGALGGSVTVPLPEGGMSVTVERIQTPNKTAVEAVGITPEVAVTLTVADMERGEDTQLQAALHALHVAWEWLLHAA